MGDKTSIEWTDATWNPIRGCSRVSEGCRHCYAEQVAARFSDPGQPYEGLADPAKPGSKWTGKVALFDKVLLQPLRWKRPRRVFVNSMSDLFHESLSDEQIDRVFAVMALAPQHSFQILTKRPERMRAYFEKLAADDIACQGIGRWHAEAAPVLGDVISDEAWARALSRDMPLPNVWLGVSVEDQAAADQRIPVLLQTPAAKRFLSCEPLLGPVDLSHIDLDGDSMIEPLKSYTADQLSEMWGEPVAEGQPGIDWVICGGESGRDARPMHPDWARSLRDQCQAAVDPAAHVNDSRADQRAVPAGVPFFFKQWGEWTPGENVDRQKGVVETATWFDQRWSFGKESLSRTDGHRDDEPDLYRVGKARAGALLDGREHREFPQ